MEPLKSEGRNDGDIDLGSISRDVTEWDQQAYRSLITTDLTAEQIDRVINPPAVFNKQHAILAIHWHPEFVPMEMIMQRVRKMFPKAAHELIIPTQHNVLMTLNGYTGVEIDCYSLPFDQKVQLLVHFAEEKVKDATVLRGMLEHTFKYRSSQLFEFIDSILKAEFADRVTQAAAKTGATPEILEFVRIHVTKLQKLIEQNEATTPPDMLKNKLIRNYFNALRELFDDQLINHAQFFLNAIKKIVKQNFSPTYFYRTQEVIEEVRGLGGGIVIPHPEQFWPILLADYDVDGIEVWNPQSRQYTEFLINCVHRQNKARRDQRPLLIFMGDDTHFGEKVLDPTVQDEAKAGRELGVQPAWDDLLISKSLIVANTNRRELIAEYRARLD